MASVSRVHVDDDGIFAATRGEIVLDVLFDERRIWSFWLIRDGEERDGGHHVAWPPALQRFLDGTTRLARGRARHRHRGVRRGADLRLRARARGSRSSTRDGKPLGLDKCNRLAQTFDTRSDEHVAPLLDSIEEVLAALRDGRRRRVPGLRHAARRGPRREADRPRQRRRPRLRQRAHPPGRRGPRVLRAAAPAGGDGLPDQPLQRRRVQGRRRWRPTARSAGLDVFGGFLHDGNLLPDGRDPRPRSGAEWIFPLGTTTLEGRTLPGAGRHRQAAGPRRTARLAGARPGLPLRDAASRRVRRLNGWFRGHPGRPRASGTGSLRAPPRRPGASEPAPFAGAGPPSASRTLARRRRPRLRPRRRRATGWPRRGVPAVGLDFPPRGAERLAAQAAESRPHRDVPLDVQPARARVGARLGRPLVAPTPPGPRRAVLARHLVDATDAAGREHLWRFARDGAARRRPALPGVPGARRGRRRLARGHVLRPLARRGRDRRARGARRHRRGTAQDEPRRGRGADTPRRPVVVGSVDWWSNGRHEHAREGLPGDGQGPVTRVRPGGHDQARGAGEGARGRGAGVPPAQPAAGRAHRRGPGAAAPGRAARRGAHHRSAWSATPRTSADPALARKVFLHVGLPKTGTTYLQSIAWANKTVLREQGVLLPGFGPRQHLWASCVVREEQRLERRHPDAHLAWQQLTDDARDWTGTALISHEFFAGASEDQVRAALMPTSTPPRCTWWSPPARSSGWSPPRWQEWVKNGGTSRDRQLPAPRSAATPRRVGLGHLRPRPRAAPVGRDRAARAGARDPDARRGRARATALAQLRRRARARPGLRATPPRLPPTSPSGVVEVELLRRINPHLDGVHGADRQRASGSAGTSPRRSWCPVTASGSALRGAGGHAAGPR